MKILSLGWGVQSFTLAAMSALGEFEKPDYAIHADTTHESSWTYKFASKWTPWLVERGLRVVTVTPPDAEAIDRFGGVMIPAFGDSGGRFSRQCTSSWKVNNIKRFVQSARNGKPVEQWIGISLDEFQRMRPTGVKYLINRWPLIEKRMTRNDCIKWLISKKLEVPKKSSCTFCPFHSTKEWTALKGVDADWNEALYVDEKIRNARLPGRLFIHPSRKPLSEVDFRTAEEKGQLGLWDEECFGVCGI